MTDTFPAILAGRYEIRDLIGRGGMAEVHLGYDRRLNRVIAIKLLRSDLASDSTFQTRFQREAQSAAALNHPSIVAVYDSGEEALVQPDGTSRTVPYIVMEYVEGHTVRELLGDGEAVPIPEAVEIVTGVLDALEYSHRAGIVHRDIKPGNIMITSTGAVKVMDFGIARAIEDSAATVTQQHAVVGTAQYLSPEQARGEVVDTRSDLYSTGCLLYELLTGQPPFTGDSAVAIAYQHVREVPKPPSSIAADIPEAIDRVVLKALAKRRDDRYGDAAHMRSDLLAAQRGSAVSAPAASAWAAAPTTTLPQQADAFSPARPETPAPPPPTPQQPLVMPTEKDDERDSKNRLGLWLLIAALIVAVALGAWAISSGKLGGADPKPTASPTPTSVTVPDVTGKSEQEAKAAIESVGLVYAKGDDVASDTIPSGRAVSTDPAVGTGAAPGSTVTVQYSLGTAMVEVPDVSGKTQEEARDALEKAGLKVGTSTSEDSAEVGKDKVIRTNPTADTTVQRGSSVALVLSTGRVTVPDIKGMTLEAAQTALQDAGLTYNVNSPTTEKTSDQSKKDATEVTGTSPVAGASVDAGSQVTIDYKKYDFQPAPTATASKHPQPGDQKSASPAPSSPPNN
ncbi:serine/threonine protein kinase PknA [Actinomyces sp. Chiba101]|uniref:Stk1 family PASTA domain-containing Ser/Thr kinase n=1 Tax=Actinomyces TaxID=1654 RepID=UPI000974E93B|nr:MULTISPECIES: Stk1 family PASTA domain-containing Ser/Thr kinase [Actinomyces]BAW91897.1 serine/threonine protein kinase PknA [Actinomyces sp. Chiba101]GAV95178.1 serine/threonine protein kinase PknA [Actinomyces denticolens]SUU12800.1 Serine/threonine-protein kinase pknB [Actinomyces denticolens]